MGPYSKRKTEDKWTREQLMEALVNISKSKITAKEAVKMYGIPKATLYRNYNKFVRAGKPSGLERKICKNHAILSPVEEGILEKNIEDLREQGFSVKSRDIKRICFEYCEKNRIPNQFKRDKREASEDWYRGFLRRRKNLRLSREAEASSGDGGTTSSLSPPGPSSHPGNEINGKCSK